MNGPDAATVGPSPFEGRASRGHLRVTGESARVDATTESAAYCTSKIFRSVLWMRSVLLPATM